MSLDSLIHEKVKFEFPLYARLDDYGFNTQEIQWLFDPTEAMPAILYNLKGKIRPEAFVYVLNQQRHSNGMEIYNYKDLAIYPQENGNYDILINGTVESSIKGRSPIAVLNSVIYGDYMGFINQDAIIFLPIQPNSINNLGSVFQYPKSA